MSDAVPRTQSQAPPPPPPNPWPALEAAFKTVDATYKGCHTLGTPNFLSLGSAQEDAFAKEIFKKYAPEYDVFETHYQKLCNAYAKAKAQNTDANRCALKTFLDASITVDMKKAYFKLVYQITPGGVVVQGMDCGAEVEAISERWEKGLETSERFVAFYKHLKTFDSATQKTFTPECVRKAIVLAFSANASPLGSRLTDDRINAANQFFDSKEAQDILNTSASGCMIA